MAVPDPSGHTGRMKIVAPDKATFWQIGELLRASDVEIHVINVKRGFYSTGPITNGMADDLLSMNATVSIERRWTSEDLLRGNPDRGLD